MAWDDDVLDGSLRKRVLRRDRAVPVTGDQLMRLLRSFRVAMATISLLAVLVPSVSAASPRSFHLDKTCAADPTEPLDFVCTVQHSDFKWFPPGVKVHYVSQNSAGDVVEATISIQNGSTNGTCVWSGPVNAVCTFRPGDGRLTEFHLVVDVTANGDASIWYWDGTYGFGGGG
jgi:hypothetical protein